MQVFKQFKRLLEMALVFKPGTEPVQKAAGTELVRGCQRLRFPYVLFWPLTP